MRNGAACAALAFSAAALSLLAAANERLPGDLWLARRIQDLPGWFEPVAELVRGFTSTEFVVPAGLFLVAVLALQRRWQAWIAYTAMLLVLPPAQAAIKDMVDRPRPDPALLERRATFTSESFPSGHVLGGTAVVVLVAILVASRAGPGRARAATWAVAFAACGLNGLANVYEGVHWPSDVLGGYLWAGVFLCAATLAARYRASSTG